MWVRVRTPKERERATYAGMYVDPRWEKFENFLADMGERPEGKTLDREDNTKGYYKDNCRWATSFEQMNNRGAWKHSPEGLERIRAATKKRHADKRRGPTQ
jgi:hypothetical protein